MNKPLIDARGEAPELGDKFFTKARRGRPPLSEENRKKRVTLFLDPEVIKHFKSGGKGWQTRINEVLQEYRSRR